MPVGARALGRRLSPRCRSFSTLHKSRVTRPIGNGKAGRWTKGRLSIGRGPGNGWVLQDPAQHLSKTHCVVAATPGGYVLTDTSSNGVFLNGSKKRLERDSDVVIGDGDEFVLGDYLVRVSEVASLNSRSVAAGAASSPRGSAPAIDRDDPFGLDEFLAPPPAPPLAKPPAARAPLRQADPFADPRLSETRRPVRRRRTARRHRHVGTPVPAASRPFGEPAAPRAGPGTHDPFDLREPSKDPVRRGRGGHVPRQGVAHHLAGALAAGQRGRGGAGLPAAQGRGAGQASTIGTACWATNRRRAWRRPRLPRHSPFGRRRRPRRWLRPPPAMPAEDAGRLLAAFLEGAGVPRLDVSGQDPAAYFHDLGALFAMMVESLRDVLMSRATVKGEFGVEQTMLRSRNNNALKFSVTPADAVGRCCSRGRPGYMAPMRAAKEGVRRHPHPSARGDGRGAGGAVQTCCAPSTRRRSRGGCRRARSSSR